MQVTSWAERKTGVAWRTKATRTAQPFNHVYGARVALQRCPILRTHTKRIPQYRQIPRDGRTPLLPLDKTYHGCPEHITNKGFIMTKMLQLGMTFLFAVLSMMESTWALDVAGVVVNEAWKPVADAKVVVL